MAGAIGSIAIAIVPPYFVRGSAFDVDLGNAGRAGSVEIVVAHWSEMTGAIGSIAVAIVPPYFVRGSALFANFDCGAGGAGLRCGDP